MAKFKNIKSQNIISEEKLTSPLAIGGYEELIADRFGGTTINIDILIQYILNIIKKNYNINNIPDFIVQSLKQKLSNFFGADASGNMSIQADVVAKIMRLAQADPLAAMMGGPTMPAPAGAMPPGVPGSQGENETIITGPIQTIAELIADADVVNTIKSNPQLSPEEIALDIWQKYGGTEDGKVDSSKVGYRTDSDQNRDIEKVKKEKSLQDEQNKQYERLPKGQTLEDIEISLDDLTKAITAMPFSIVQKVKGQGAPQGGGMPGMMASSQGLMRKTAKFKAVNLAKIVEEKYWA